ncbi:MAG: ester cyclase [Actinobacteria bacterium]|nr:ester cyclase [Actinomycetota bacterium]
MARLLEAFSGFEAPLEEILAEDDRVVTRYRACGTHRGRLMGIPPRSRRVEVTGTRPRYEVRNAWIIQP